MTGSAGAAVLWDAVIIGAGAAGLHAAAIAGQRGLSVLLIDHSERIAEKIRISGGGRCNFTNRDVGPANFSSANPDFCRSALARYTPADFVALVRRHGIGFHEKHRGQLFCDDSSERIIALLLAECAAGGVTRWQPCRVQAVRSAGAGFALDTDRSEVRTRQLVVATGGLSIPKIGASDFGYRLARQFGLGVIEPRPALVPLSFDATAWAPFAPLAGVSLPVAITAGAGRERMRFDEDLLFTHRGLSGPAALQISTYWRPGEPIGVDLVPGSALAPALLAAKHGRRSVAAVLAEVLPRRLADAWLSGGPLEERPVAEVRDRELAALAAGLHRWPVVPATTEGYRKAEVTAGGVDTRDLDSRSCESRLVPGLYFIGEVVDVTGWLGGYNFQWAWASAAACARAVGVRCRAGRGGL
jgi:predicted Rossmann fold flavoprotein